MQQASGLRAPSPPAQHLHDIQQLTGEPGAPFHGPPRQHRSGAAPAHAHPAIGAAQRELGATTLLSAARRAAWAPQPAGKVPRTLPGSLRRPRHAAAAHACILEAGRRSARSWALPPPPPPAAAAACRCLLPLEHVKSFRRMCVASKPCCLLLIHTCGRVEAAAAVAA